MLRLYWEKGRSKLYYGAQIFASATQNSLKNLEAIHNQALRIWTGAFRSSLATTIAVEANELPLALRRTELAMRHMKIKSITEYEESMNVLNEEKDHHYNNSNNLKKLLGTSVRAAIQSLDHTLQPQHLQSTSFSPWKLEKVSFALIT